MVTKTIDPFKMEATPQQAKLNKNNVQYHTQQLLKQSNEIN